jgi:hypothetical protein
MIHIEATLWRLMRRQGSCVNVIGSVEEKEATSPVDNPLSESINAQRDGRAEEHRPTR